MMPETGIKEKIRQHKGEVLLCILAAVLLVPTVFNVFEVRAESVEPFSVKLANMPIPELLHVTAQDVHPPLYYLILRGAILLFGNHIVVYRLVSFLPYLMLMVFAFVFQRREFGPYSAAIFMTLASFTTTALLYNTQIRMYSWCAFFLAMAFYALYRVFCEGRRRDYVLLAVFSLCAGYTQYYALVTAAWMYLFLLFCLLRRKERTGLRNWILSAGIAIVGYLPWLMVFLSTFKRTAGQHWMTETASFLRSYKSIFSARFSIVWPTLWIALTVYLLFLDVRQSGDAAKAAKSPQGLSGFSLWLLAGVAAVLGTILTGIVISALTRPMYNIRYLYPASPVAWFCLAAGCERLRAKKILVPAAILFFLAFQIPNHLLTLRHNLALDSEIRRTVAAIQEKNPDGAILLSPGALGGYDDMVILDMGYATAPVTDFYLRGIVEEKRINAEDPAGWGLEKGKRYFLFLSAPMTEEQRKEAEDCGYVMECLERDVRMVYSFDAVYYVTAK